MVSRMPQGAQLAVSSYPVTFTELVETPAASQQVSNSTTYGTAVI